MSNADQVGLIYKEEVTYGENPAGTFDALRFTSESLAKATDTTQSTEIRSDRQVTDLIRNGIRVNGGVNFEFSFAAYDKLLSAALFSADFPAAAALLDVNGNNAITIVAATGVMTDDAAGGLFTPVNVGDWLNLSNFTDALNNVPVKVIAKADNDTITVAGLKTLADETRAASGAGANAAIDRGSFVTNGVTQRSFTFERQYTDLTRFSMYRGLVVETLVLNANADAIINGSFAFLGKDNDILTAVTASAGAANAAPTNDVMNAIDNVFGIIEGAPAVNTDNEFCAVSLALTIANNLRERAKIGELGPESVGAGKFNVTGTMTAYFDAAKAATLADKYTQFTESALALIFRDTDGNFYVIDIPRVRLSQGQKVAGGENTDVLLDMAFTGYRHETEGVTLRIVKFAA